MTRIGNFAKLMSRLDLSFTLGRAFSILPVVVLSYHFSDETQLASQLSQYQVALFLSTLVLYGAPQVYLVKKGVETRIFPFHMAITGLLLAVVLLSVEKTGFGAQVGVLAFFFLVFFRSYYLLFATYYKDDPQAGVLLVGAATAVIILFALTADYVVSGISAFACAALFLVYKGFVRWLYLLVAMRNYFTLLYRNFWYFCSFLFQQMYTQVVLAIYALMESGSAFIFATHAVYIYAISFVFHGVLFRVTLGKMGRAAADRGMLLQHLRDNVRRSLTLGLCISLVLLAFSRQIELLLFKSAVLTPSAVWLLCGMICMHSINFGWGAVFTAIRKPDILVGINVASSLVLISVLFWLRGVGADMDILIAMASGLGVQVILRNAVGAYCVRETAKAS